MLKFIALTLFIAGANAFFSSCGIAGVIGPDNIVSSHCTGARCQVVRGSFFYANAFITPVKIHQRLDTRATIFLLGPLPGIPVCF